MGIPCIPLLTLDCTQHRMLNISSINNYWHIQPQTAGVSLNCTPLNPPLHPTDPSTCPTSLVTAAKPHTLPPCLPTSVQQVYINQPLDDPIGKQRATSSPNTTTPCSTCSPELSLPPITSYNISYGKRCRTSLKAGLSWTMSACQHYVFYHPLDHPTGKKSLNSATASSSTCSPVPSLPCALVSSSQAHMPEKKKSYARLVE